MGIHFIFATHPLRSSEVEETFADQFEALSSAGFTASLCPEAVIKEGKLLRNIPPGATVVYRGWMLSPTEYEQLADAGRTANAIPFTMPTEYLATHYLPNWYPHIAEFTPETRVLPVDADFEAELRSIGWQRFFVKDYVKSLKTSCGAIINNPAEIKEVIAEMKKYRGEIEGGLCVRRVEPFLPKSEQRYFVLNGRPFSANEVAIPDIVFSVADRIASRFFSVDVIRRTDGVFRIVEIGDGQVSDIVGWSAERFAEVWRTAYLR